MSGVFLREICEGLLDFSYKLGGGAKSPQKALKSMFVRSSLTSSVPRCIHSADITASVKQFE